MQVANWGGANDAFLGGAGSGPAPHNRPEGQAMFEPVFENLRKATEASIQMQQDLFKKWVALWPGVTQFPAVEGVPFTKFQKKWTEVVTELVKKQRETMEAQFGAGLRNIEEAFHLADVKDPEELRAKTVEFWQKSFDCLRHLYDVQVRDFQHAAAKWGELFTKGAA
jgi:hypothetical protein